LRNALCHGKIAGVKLSSARLRLDHVLTEALEFIARNLPRVLLLGFLLVGLPEFLFDWSTLAAPDPPGEDNAAASMVIEAIRASLFHGAVAYLFWQELEGRRLSWGELVRPGLAVFVPLLSVGVLMNLALETGFYFLWLFGALLYPFIGLAVVVAVVEQAGIPGAFVRAFQVLRGARLKALLLYGLYVAVAWGADWLAVEVGLGTYYYSDRPFGLVPALLTCAVASTVTDIYLASTAAALYFELRRLREVAPPEDPAAVFD
jgi:hypothetical protein